MANLKLIPQIDAAYEREAEAAKHLADLLIELNDRGEEPGRYRDEVNEAIAAYREATQARTALTDQFQASVKS